MKLDAYIREHGLTDAAFGALVGLSQPQVSKIRRGKHWPSRETMDRIREATGGAVTPNDFLTIVPAKSVETENAA